MLAPQLIPYILHFVSHVLKVTAFERVVRETDVGIFFFLMTFLELQELLVQEADVADVSYVSFFWHSFFCVPLLLTSAGLALAGS